MRLHLVVALLSVTLASGAEAQLLTNGMPADNVLGQTNFASFGAALTQGGMDRPSGLAYDPAGKRLFVGIGGSQHRILVYDLSAGITNGMNAVAVLGQPDFVTGTANTANAALGCTTAVNACGMGAPAVLFYDQANQRLFVSDVTDNRVVVYELAGGITNGMRASFVLGQPDFTTGTSNTPNPAAGCTTAVNACGFRIPSGIWYDDPTKRLFVVDLFNSRLLVFDLSAGITNGMAAAHVLGQTDFISTTQNALVPANGCTSTVNACGMVFPREVVLDAAANRLFVNDSTDNYRILVFDVSGGITDGMAAVKVLGQTSLTTRGQNGQNPAAGCTTAVNACGFDTGEGMLWDPSTGRFYLADTLNHRIVVWDLSGGLTNGMAAVRVLGHADLQTGEGFVNTPPFFGGEQYQNAAYGCTTTPNACGLGNVNQVALDPVRHVVFASDFNAARVLTYGAIVGQYPVTPAGNVSSLITLTNADASKTFVITDTLGGTYSVTLPPSAAPLSGSSITVTVTASATTPAIQIAEAPLPAGVTKTASIPRGDVTASFICVKDSVGATIGGPLPTCPLSTNRIRIPAAGACCAFPSPSCPGLTAGQSICTSAANTTITVAGLHNSALEVYYDADGDGVDDAVDHCPDTVLEEPDPFTRPGRLDDSETLLGCDRTQILACKPGRNAGEMRRGLSVRSQAIFTTKITDDPRGWAERCLEMYPNP